MKKILVPAIAFASLLATTAVQGSLVVNGDFENGLTGWSHTPDVTTVPGGVTGNAAQMTIDNIGPNATFMSSLYQTVGVQGQTYFVDFYVKTTGIGGAWDAFYDGKNLVSDTGPGPSTFTHYEFTVTPTSTPVLLFDFYQYGSTGAMLVDNVSVVPVPESSTLFLAGSVPLLALGADMFRRRRRDRPVTV